MSLMPLKWIIISAVNSASLTDVHTAQDITHTPPEARRILKPTSDTSRSNFANYKDNVKNRRSFDCQEN